MNTTLKIMSFGGVAVASCFGCTAMAQQIDPPTPSDQSTTGLDTASSSVPETDTSAVSTRFQSNSFDEL